MFVDRVDSNVTLCFWSMPNGYAKREWHAEKWSPGLFGTVQPVRREQAKDLDEEVDDYRPRFDSRVRQRLRVCSNDAHVNVERFFEGVMGEISSPFPLLKFLTLRLLPSIGEGRCP